MDSSKPKYIEDQNEEELKRLQREEALADSEEYDISDEIYNDAPVARQYVEDEEIAGGARFGENEKQLPKPSAPNMVDDLPDTKPEPQPVAPADKYIKKPGASSAMVEKSDDSNTTLKSSDNKKQNNAMSPIEDSSISKARTVRSPTKRKIAHCFTAHYRSCFWSSD